MMEKIRILLVLTIIAGLGACDTGEDQGAFDDRAFSKPSGITQTSKSGRVLSEDEDDWQISPAYFGRIVVDPAFPNPVPSGEFVTIPIRVRISGSVQGRLNVVSYDNNRIERRLDTISDAQDPGAYVFRFMPRILGLNGLIRVFIVDTQGGIVSYGDLQVTS